ncbi:MAG: B12-binding domain-containing radical SAM protein [Candidatus Omnitrophica bacterium]|nr:B12-binding domain-containing radical SAM protein [Candidatus Omnitrophota bacterium]
MRNKIKLLFIKPHFDALNLLIEVPLGILCLSAYLKKHLGNQVDINFLDLRIEKNKKQVLIDKLTSYQPDIIGVSLMACDHNFFDKNIKTLKKYSPEAKIIAGGSYATYNYSEILTKNKIECAVIGEGEEVLLNLTKKYLKNECIHDIKGIAYQERTSVISTGREEYIEDLDSLPLPDYSILEIHRYWNNPFIMGDIRAEKKRTHVMSSRACPYKCIYCHDIFGKKLRKRSPENFFNEIKMLYNDYGIKEFNIVDDIFNVDRPRMHDILNLIIDSGLKIKIAFPNGIKADILTKEDIFLLKKAGTYIITFPIETSSKRLQKLIKKEMDLDKIIENIKYANKLGIITNGFIMIGFPTETVDEIKKTINFAINSGLNMASFFSVAPFKGTALFELANQQHKVDYKIHNDFFVEKPYYEAATGFKLTHIQKLAFLRFYSLKRILTLFLKSPSKFYFFLWLHHKFASFLRFLLKIIRKTISPSRVDSTAARC